MTPEQLELVQTSYAALGATPHRRWHADFYDRLFEADPTTKELFSDGPGRHGRQVRRRAGRDRGGDHVVRDLRSDESAISPPVTSATGCRPGTTTRSARPLSLRSPPTSTRNGTPTLEAAWRRAYNLVAELMMATAATIAR